MKRCWILTPGLLLYVCSFSFAQDVAIESSFFDSNGVKIAYITAGQGEPVLLVHGLYSSALMNWQMPGIVKLLAQHYSVIALDLRGHGKSDKPTDDASYGEPMVDDLTRLLDHLYVEKAHVIGYSLGGIIVMRFAIEHPDRVRSAALGGMGWLREGGLLPRVFERMNGGDTTTPPAAVHGISRLAVTQEQVQSIKLPMEILVGDRDPCRQLYVQPLHAIRPDIPVVLINDAGHINCIVKPQFQQGLLDWLDKNAGH